MNGGIKELGRKEMERVATGEKQEGDKVGAEMDGEGNNGRGR